MNLIILCGLAAFLISTLMMPLFVRVSKRLDAVSEIGGRHVGVLPVGRLGGAGILCAIGISMLILVVVDLELRQVVCGNMKQSLGLGFGLFVVAVVGFWDDVKRLPATVKFCAHAIAAVIAYGSGLRITGVDLPLIEPIQFGWLALPVTVIWVVGIVNAINLIDGLDGLAGGVILFGSIVNLVTAIGSGAVLPALLMVSIVGSVLGFLIYNWHPARIYMGDGGAYSLGFLLSISGLLSPNQKASTGIAILVSVLTMGLPIFDTLLTMFRRYLKNRALFSPDRGHLHHMLLDAGMSHRRVVIGLYGVCVFLCSIALLVVLVRNRNVGYCLVLASVFWVLFWGVSVKNELLRAVLHILKCESDKGKR